MWQCVREIIDGDECAQYSRQLKPHRSSQLAGKEDKNVYVGTALKMERAQGRQGEDRAQGQKDNAVRQ